MILDEGGESQRRGNSSTRRKIHAGQGTKINHIDETNREYLSQEIGDEGSSQVIDFNKIDLDGLEDNQNSSSNECIIEYPQQPP